MGQQVEARVRRSGKADDVHLCNSPVAPTSVAQPLHTAVALSIRRMRSSIFAPVARVACTPFRLRMVLVVAMVAVVTKPVFLPVASTGALARLRGAISQTGNMPRAVRTTHSRQGRPLQSGRVAEAHAAGEADKVIAGNRNRHPLGATPDGLAVGAGSLHSIECGFRSDREHLAARAVGLDDRQVTLTSART